MRLPRFFDRTTDALMTVIPGAAREQLVTLLGAQPINLVASENVAHDETLSAGYLFAANLASRLYPRIALSAPRELLLRTVDLVKSINPSADIEEPADRGVTLIYGRGEPDSRAVVVNANGWNASVDLKLDDQPHQTPAIPAAMAAGAMGIGEVFRTVFADFLPKGRRGPEPGGFNLITLDAHSQVPAAPSHAIDIGAVHLVGAGAIGQSCVATLKAMSLRGRIVAIDPEDISLSNLQRYVLTDDSSPGLSKTAMVADALDGTALSVQQVTAAWQSEPELVSSAERALVAVDSERDRMQLQASLPRRIYNAYTQPHDLGWSRHEVFGASEPCLACLYWPRERKASRNKLVADSLGINEIRALAYLLIPNITVDQPLPAEWLAGLPTPPSREDIALWSTQSLLAQLAAAWRVARTELEQWEGRTLDALYREGICGGLLLSFLDSGPVGEAVVPMAHQSALAGVMLATQLIASVDPELRVLRPWFTEGRYDVLAPPKQQPARPRESSPGCICRDTDFVAVWTDRWPTPDREETTQ